MIDAAAHRLRQMNATAQRWETPCGDGTMVWRGWGAAAATNGVLVLLHGGAGSWRHWVRNIEPLSTARYILVPDIPGLGDSAMPPDPTSPERIADILASGLRSVVAEFPVSHAPCDLVGFSFGALVAGNLAARHSDLFRSLTLIGPGAMGGARNTPQLVKIRDKKGIDRIEAHRTNLARLMISDPARIDNLAVRIQDENTRLMRLSSMPIAMTETLKIALGKVRQKPYVIFGERDASVGCHLPDRMKIIRETRPDADISLISDAGHWVAYEAPERFHRKLLDIIGGGSR